MSRPDASDSPRPGLSHRRKILYASIPSVLIFGLAYAGNLIYRAHPIYDYLKDPKQGFLSRVYESNPKLGGVPAPNVRSGQLMRIGEPVPIRHDERGFRIPDSGPVGLDRSRTLMFFGCSHTYGQGVLAEETFANLAAEALDARPVNAGVCGAGLSYMLGRAKETVPQVKPDIIVVQYSPWLVDRSVIRFAPSRFRKNAVTYFTETADGLELVPPVFFGYSASFDKIAHTPRGAGDYCRFLFGSAMPALIHDDLSMTGFHLRRLFGQIPPIVTDKKRVEAATYAQFAEIAEAHGAQMVVLVLGWQLLRVPMPSDVVPAGIPIVHGHDAMIKVAEESPDPVRLSLRYGRHFYQVRGDPPEVVDMGHPNDKAHAVIADTLVKGIQATEAQ